MQFGKILYLITAGTHFMCLNFIEQLIRDKKKIRTTEEHFYPQTGYLSRVLKQEKM